VAALDREQDQQRRRDHDDEDERQGVPGPEQQAADDGAAAIGSPMTVSKMANPHAVGMLPKESFTMPAATSRSDS